VWLQGISGSRMAEGIPAVQRRTKTELRGERLWGEKRTSVDGGTEYSLNNTKKDRDIFQKRKEFSIGGKPRTKSKEE